MPEKEIIEGREKSGGNNPTQARLRPNQRPQGQGRPLQAARQFLDDEAKRTAAYRDLAYCIARLSGYNSVSNHIPKGLQSIIDELLEKAEACRRIDNG